MYMYIIYIYIYIYIHIYIYRKDYIGRLYLYWKRTLKFKSRQVSCFLLSPTNSLNGSSSCYSSYCFIIKQKTELRSNGLVTSTIMLHLPLIFIFYNMV